MSSRDLLALLRINSPILQAPMAGVSTPEMAAAVSNAGALGGIAVGATTAENGRQLLAAFRERSSRSVNVNVFCQAPPTRDRRMRSTSGSGPSISFRGSFVPWTDPSSLRAASWMVQVSLALSRSGRAARNSGRRSSPSTSRSRTTVIGARSQATLRRRHARTIPDYPIAYDLGKALHAAAQAKNEFGYGAQWAGQGAPFVRSMPAAKLVEALRHELDAASR
jgi:NAD(P)H-dependent flavin oxidoreductase YrpB (nitropropane dioxygenase family)